MRNWMFFALLAPVVYTIVIFIDKYILSREIRDYSGMPIFTALTGFFAGVACFVIAGYPVLSFYDGLIVLATGILTVWGLYFYFQALAQDDASNVIVFFQLIPLLVLIMAYIFLGDVITWKQMVGFVVILMSVLMVSIKDGKKDVRLSRTLALVFLVDIFWSAASVLMKYAVDTNSFAAIISYESFGVTLGGVLLYVCFPSIRAGFYKNISSLHKRVFGMLFVNEALFILSKSLAYYAYSFGPAALVSVIGSTQTFFGIVLGWILTIMMPKVFCEQIRRQTLIRKMLAAAVLSVGIAMIV